MEPRTSTHLTRDQARPASQRGAAGCTVIVTGSPGRSGVRRRSIFLGSAQSCRTVAIFASLDRVPEWVTISERVRELIAQSGSSQGEFAARIGLDNSKLSKSLGGARRFSSLDLARIAASSHVSVDWLLTGQEAPLALAARAEGGSSSEQAVGEAERLSNARSDIAFLGYPQPWQPLKLPALRGRLSDQGTTLATHAERRFAAHGLDPTGSDLAGANRDGIRRGRGRR